MTELYEDFGGYDDQDDDLFLVAWNAALYFDMLEGYREAIEDLNYFNNADPLTVEDLEKKRELMNQIVEHFRESLAENEVQQTHNSLIDQVNQVSKKRLDNSQLIVPGEPQSLEAWLILALCHTTTGSAIESLIDKPMNFN